jgi:DNA-binding MarR family transcriptional regulator
MGTRDVDWQHVRMASHPTKPVAGLLLISEDHRTSPSGIARGFGVTRQSAHVLLGQLIELGITGQHRDPADRRRRLVHPTDHGRALAADARKILADLERELGERIGPQAVDSLGPWWVRTGDTSDAVRMRPRPDPLSA